MNYKGKIWNNKTFGNSSKITVSQIIDLYLDRLEKVKDFYDSETSSYYIFENKICEIINNVAGEYLNGKVYPTDITVGNPKCDFEKEGSYNGGSPFGKHSFIRVGLEEIWDKKLESKIERKNVHDGGYFLENTNYRFPDILINDDFNIISSLPDHEIHYVSMDRDVCSHYRSLVPSEIFDSIVDGLKNNEVELRRLKEEFYDKRNVESTKKVTERKKEFLESINGSVIKLDNGMSLKFSLKDEHVFDRGNFDASNIFIDVYDKGMNQVEHIDGSNLFVSGKMTTFSYDTLKVNNDYKKFLNYKTDSSCVSNLYARVDKEFIKGQMQQNKLDNDVIEKRKMELYRQLELQKRYEKSFQVMENKKANDEILKEKIKSGKEELLDDIVELGKREMFPKRVELPKEILCDWNDKKNCFEINPKIRSHFKYVSFPIDLEDVDMTNADLRDSDIYFPTLKDIKDMSLKGCNLSLNKGLLNSVNDYNGFNLKDAVLYSEEMIFLSGAKLNDESIKSLNKKYIKEAIKDAILDDSAIDLINNKWEEYNIDEAIQVKHEVDGKEELFLVPSALVKDDSIESKNLEIISNYKNKKNNINNNGSNINNLDFSSFTNEEAIDVVLGLINAGKINSDQLELLAQHYRVQENNNEQINKGSSLK